MIAPLVLVLVAAVSRYQELTGDQACWITRFEETSFQDCTSAEHGCTVGEEVLPDVIFYDNGIMWDPRIFKPYPQMQGYLQTDGARFVDGWESIGHPYWSGLGEYNFYSFIPAPTPYMYGQYGDAGLTIALKKPYKPMTPLWQKYPAEDGIIRGVFTIYSHELNQAFMMSNTISVSTRAQGEAWLAQHVPQVTRLGFMYSNGASGTFSFSNYTMGTNFDKTTQLDLASCTSVGQQASYWHLEPESTEPTVPEPPVTEPEPPVTEPTVPEPTVPDTTTVPPFPDPQTTALPDSSRPNVALPPDFPKHSGNRGSAIQVIAVDNDCTTQIKALERLERDVNGLVAMYPDEDIIRYLSYVPATNADLSCSKGRPCLAFKIMVLNGVPYFRIVSELTIGETTTRQDGVVHEQCPLLNPFSTQCSPRPQPDLSVKVRG